MAKYSYRAINEKNAPIRGVMDAASPGDLGKKLEGSGQVLVDCKEIVEKENKLKGFLQKKISMRDLIQLFVQFDQLNRAGVPLLESIADARDTTESTRLKKVLADIHQNVSEGDTFSAAMAQHSNIFEPIFISLIAAGEETGTLKRSFKQVISHLKWTDAMRTKIKKATRYPKMLLVVCFGVIYIMMVKVVPQVTDFLLDMGKELPPITTSLIATSHFILDNAQYIFGGMAIFYFGLSLGRKFSRKFLYETDKIALKMPVMGTIISKIGLSQFARTFGVLFSSGLDILKCIESAKLTASNLVLIEAIEGVKEQVQEGMPLSEAFHKSGQFPLLIVKMVKIGEESGNLTEVLDQVSEFYDKDVNEAVDAMIESIEPTLTGILGGIVLWIAAAVFGPIYDTLGDMGK